MIYANSNEPTTLVFDLGDVLFSWSSQTKTSIPPNILQSILASGTWCEYECGLISTQECHTRAGTEFSIDPAEIASAFEQARESLQPDEQLVSLIKYLRAESGNTLRVFAMSNISGPDYDFLRTTKHVDWSVFDRVFTSAAARQRKPDLGFYKHVISEGAFDPARAIFIDDKIENVLSARSLGFHGIVFDSAANVTRQLFNLCGDPIARGVGYLRSNAGLLESVTDSGVVIEDNFAQLLILEAARDPSLVSELSSPARTWNFFRTGKGVLTKANFPNDLDTTSLGLTILPPSTNVIHSILDEMLEYVNNDGIVQTYFDKTRPRFDACVCVNVLTLFYTHSRGHELHRTLDWVHGVLVQRAYMDGTRYYTTPECFLFFMGRLLTSCKDPELHKVLMPVFKERVQERIGAEGDALALGMRILACAAAGVRNTIDRGTLLSMQCVDGGWEMGWVYKLVVSKVRIGSRGLTTAIALAALSAPVLPAVRPVVEVLQLDEHVSGRQSMFNGLHHSEQAQIAQLV